LARIAKFASTDFAITDFGSRTQAGNKIDWSLYRRPRPWPLSLMPSNPIGHLGIPARAGSHKSDRTRKRTGPLPIKGTRYSKRRFPAARTPNQQRDGHDFLKRV
jgi:hypothetical protein